jgi:hypothetical protein
MIASRVFFFSRIRDEAPAQAPGIVMHPCRFKRLERDYIARKSSKYCLQRHIESFVVLVAIGILAYICIQPKPMWMNEEHGNL